MNAAVNAARISSAARASRKARLRLGRARASTRASMRPPGLAVPVPLMGIVVLVCALCLALCIASLCVAQSEEGAPAGEGSAGSAAQEEEASETPRPDAPAPKSAVKEKQFVYGLNLFDGATFRGTFAPKAVDTVYMMADVDNLLSTKETEVYWWAITSEWNADWFTMNNEVPGTLVVSKGSKEVDRFETMEFLLEYPEGYLSDKAVLWKGADAKRVADECKQELERFYKKVSEYYQAQFEYEKALEAFMKNPKRNPIPKEPDQPVPPTRIAGEIQKGFVVSLPVGRYRMKTLDKDGKPLPGLTKDLVVFSDRRTGVGYEMIPEEKWTYPDKMDDVEQVLHYAVPGVLFLKAFNEKEYNARNYAKLTELSKPFSGQGLEFSWAWMHLDPIEKKGHKIRLECSEPVGAGEGSSQATGAGGGQAGSRTIEIEEKPYYVKQRPGSALGYDIVELPEKDPEGREPSFWAYRVQPPEHGWARLTLVDDKGQPVPGSERTLRRVKREPAGWLMWAPMLPVLAWAGVFASRKATTRGGRRRDV